MKSLELDHIGVAVIDLEEASKHYQELLGATIIHEEIVESQKVKVRFLKTGDQKIELLQATGKDSPIAKFIEKRKEGVHHIALRVDDIRQEMRRLEKEGFILLQKEPIRGAFNKWVCFIHPKSAHGMLVEICQPMQV